MALPSSPGVLLKAVTYHVRGVFATEANRRIAFRLRDIWQPAEVEARKGIARDLSAELPRDLLIDRARGYQMLEPSLLPPLDEVCQIGRTIIANASLDDGELIGAKKFFRIRLASFDERVALLRIALDRRVLAMAAAHLGTLPIISEADYFCSFPVDGPFTKSQLWHCDDDASDVFKLFIYCDNVTADHGPFTLIEAGSSKQVRDEIGYRFAGRRYRVSDEVMASHTPRGAQIEIAGPAGTAFAVATSRCFHRGSRILNKQLRRVMATICYLPPSARTIPRRLATGRAPMAEFLPRFQGELERAALGMPVARKWI